MFIVSIFRFLRGFRKIVIEFRGLGMLFLGFVGRFEGLLVFEII